MKRNNIAILCAGVLLFASCKKDFLEEVKPAAGTITEDVIFDSKLGVDNALTGIYYIMRNYVSGQQNMYGWKTVQLNFDMRGNDLISDPSNWWLYENNWTDNTYGRITTAARNAQIWNLCYKVINNANAVIKNTPNLSEAQATKDQLIGEARALRGWGYFQLARIYQFAFAKDSTAPGVPIYTEPATPASTGSPRAPLNVVYNLITSDLENAVATMTTTRVDKYRFNKNVVQGLLAEVYQEMATGNTAYWAKAISNAQAARTGFPLMSATDYKAGFNSVAVNEWMWGLQFNASQSLSFASFFGYIEPTNTPNTSFKARYNDIYVNTSFVNLFSATDARNVFKAAPSQSASLPWKKWVTTKFQDNATQTGDFVMMRSAEMYLIEAEGLAQNNLLDSAKNVLFTLQKQRDPSAVKSGAATKAALVNEILVERRKELYAEMGVQYFDLKRYQQPLVRDGNQWSVLNIPATDNRWRWQLPQTEMDANKALTAADQNPL
ncbi:MAG: RagB/SusD family nutrient uptake outer membrane protein [Williamsia sp.]|nr:RagB/SusD family nutrient uptake outer membrane protein [Williamsia sp.]